MADKLLYIFIGYSICSTLVIIILIKKPNVIYKIANLKPKIKRNKNSTIESDVSPNINIENSNKRIKQPKKGVFSKWKEKRLLKKNIN